MDDLEKSLGLPKHWDIRKDSGEVLSIKLFPVVLDDWPRFMETIGILNLDSLHSIYSYTDGNDMLLKLISIVSRREDIADISKNMNAGDYKKFREIVTGQNDLQIKDRDKIEIKNE